MAQSFADGKVWHLRLTLHFLSDDGNLLDCASLAAMTALRHFRKPEVEVIGDEIIVVSMLGKLSAFMPKQQVTGRRRSC